LALLAVAMAGSHGHPKKGKQAHPKKGHQTHPKKKAPKKAPPHVSFSKTIVRNAHNEFRRLADPSLPPVTWSTQLTAEAWKVASACNPKLFEPSNLLCTAVPHVVGWIPRKYRNDMTLSFIADPAELTCPTMLGDASVTQVGCAVARCNPLSKAKASFDPVFSRPLTKGKWDSVVCKYNIAKWTKPCNGVATGPGLAKGQKSARATFNHNLMVTLHNELRHARSPKLKPIKWSTKLEKKAYHRARMCSTKNKIPLNEIGFIVTDSPNLSWNDADVKLNFEDNIEECPGIVENPKLTAFGCAAVLCGPRPKLKLKKVWQNIYCEYNKKGSNKCFTK